MISRTTTAALGAVLGATLVSLAVSLTATACDSPRPAPEVLAIESKNVVDLGLDDTNVYWLASVGGEANLSGRVMKLPKAGGTRILLADGQFTPMVMALDGDSVFWMNAGDFVSCAGVRRIAKAGGTVTTVGSDLMTLGACQLGGLVSDADEAGALYATAALVRDAAVTYAILRVPKDGVTPTTTLALLPGQPHGLASDGAALFVTIDATSPSTTSPGAGEVLRVDKASGAITPLATGQIRPTWIAVDDAHVYWVDLHRFPVDAALFRVLKAGGEPALLAKVPEAASGLVVDGEDVFVTVVRESKLDPTGEVLRIPVAGGSLQRIAKPTCPVAPRVDADHVFFASSICYAGDVGMILRLDR